MHFKLLAFVFSIKLSANGKFRVAGMKCEELEAFLFIGKSGLQWEISEVWILRSFLIYFALLLL